MGASHLGDAREALQQQLAVGGRRRSIAARVEGQQDLRTAAVCQNHLRRPAARVSGESEE